MQIKFCWDSLGNKIMRKEFHSYYEYKPIEYKIRSLGFKNCFKLSEKMPHYIKLKLKLLLIRWWCNWCKCSKFGDSLLENK
jgi:hypothetical protein